MNCIKVRIMTDNEQVIQGQPVTEDEQCLIDIAKRVASTNLGEMVELECARFDRDGTITIKFKGE